MPAVTDERIVRTGEPSVPVASGAYRAHLDGLRAVAVYLVVAFHAGAYRFSGGFVGVDVFFVLSGYLVTQVLLRDLSEHGSIRFGRFYARRVRRLLPASMVTLLVTAVVFTAVATPAEVAEAARAFRAAFLYVANWFFLGESTEYFGDQVDENPVLHFWSLAVEEQFYIVWPVAFAAVVALWRRAGRHGWWGVRATVAAGAAASLTWALVLQRTSPDRAYFGTDARAYQLLAGALLALAPGVAYRLGRSRAAATAVAGAGCSPSVWWRRRSSTSRPSRVAPSWRW